jgi:hypothetical protein
MTTGHRRRWSVLFVTIAIVAIVLLSAAFRNLELSTEWRPLPRFERTEEPVPESQEPGAIETSTDLYIALLVLSLLLVVVVIVRGIMSPKTRKRTLTNLALVLCLVAISLALNRPPDSSEPFAGQPATALPGEEPASSPGATSAVPIPFEPAASPPSWMIWGATVILAMFVAAGLVAGGWFIWRYTHPPVGALQQLAQEAQSALDALRAGADPKDTVLRCYLEMSRVLRSQRGIVRQQAMTPREFEGLLEQAGLPNQQVRQLTRLFESVRYGARMPAGYEERQAIDCLAAIVAACGSSP